MMVGCRRISTIIALQIFVWNASALNKQRLTRKRVTASSFCERGAAVELHSDSQDDPLAAERARVVIYLEGQSPTTPASAVMEKDHTRTVTIAAWHGAAGTIKQMVSVVPKRGASVEFFVPLDENGITSVEARR